MYAQGSWGEERNAWLVELSYSVAIGAAILMLLILAVVFRGPLLRIVLYPLRPFAPVLNGVRLLLIMTPLRKPLHRYLYVGRHLAMGSA